MERDRVRIEAQKRLMAKRTMQRDLLHILMLKKMNSKEIQIRTREQEKRSQRKCRKEATHILERRK
jgi:hypothetical protein